MLVRTHADDPRLPVLLNALAGKSSYHALLAVEAARALGDEDRLRELAKHPSRRVRFRAAACLPLRVKDPQVFAADYAARPIGDAFAAGSSTKAITNLRRRCWRRPSPTGNAPGC